VGKKEEKTRSSKK